MTRAQRHEKEIYDFTHLSSAGKTFWKVVSVVAAILFVLYLIR